MSEIKVFELAKDLGVTTSDLMAVLKDLEVPVTGGSSVLDTSTAETVREMIAQDKDLVAQAKTLELPQSLTVRELAETMGMPPADIQKRLVEMGILASVNQQIGADVAGKSPRNGATQSRLSRGKTAAAQARQADGAAEVQARDKDGAEAAGRHRDGPCRPRQDHAARRHPQAPTWPSRRGRRHHPAHRRLSGRLERQEDHLPGHPGPRGVYRDACPRRRASPTSPCWWSPPMTA